MSRISKVLRDQEEAVLAEWMREQTARGIRTRVIKGVELRAQSRELLRLLADAFESESRDVQSDAYAPVRELVSNLSRTRQLQGFTPAETSWFVLSRKKPIAQRLRKAFADDRGLVDELMHFDDARAVHGRPVPEVARRGDPPAAAGDARACRPRW